MNAADFEKKVLDGSITDFEPYFKKASSHKKELELLEPINPYLIKTRLNNIINQPLLASNNVAKDNLYDIKKML